MQIRADYTPVRITFGTGSFEKISGLIDGRRYCAVTYGEPHFKALLERLAASAGAPALVIDDVAPNPDFDLLSAQAKRFRPLTTKLDVFVALGGGSVIDTAKVLASASGDFDRVKTFLQTKSGEETLGSTPIIAVPTTSGTGSEVTCWGTVWDSASGRKYSLNRAALYPQHAVIDPDLMLAKPRALTISTGLDALSHTLESLWNINATQESAKCAVSAAIEILDVLPKLADDLGSLELRSRMAAAALMSGIAFSKTKTAIAHSISYPITLRHGVAHGIACSFTLPIVLSSVAEKGGLCGASLRQIFGPDLAVGARHLSKFLNALGISANPVDHGPVQAEWQSLINAAFDGERGQNFIGTRDNFHAAAKKFGIE